jgi:hypothetical protein
MDVHVSNSDRSPLLITVRGEVDLATADALLASIGRQCARGRGLIPGDHAHRASRRVRRRAPQVHRTCQCRSAAHGHTRPVSQPSRTHPAPTPVPAGRESDRPIGHRDASPGIDLREPVTCGEGACPAAHFASPDTRLIDVAMITAPSGNESHAWRSAVRRISLDPMFVSETWNVMPIVNAR